MALQGGRHVFIVERHHTTPFLASETVSLLGVVVDTSIVGLGLVPYKPKTGIANEGEKVDLAEDTFLVKCFLRCQSQFLIHGDLPALFLDTIV